jgi:hypothetical protein
MLLLYPIELEKLFFQMVTFCPALFIQASRVGVEVQLSDLVEQDLFCLFGVTSQIMTPTSEMLSESRTHEIPPVNDVSASHSIS